MAANKSDLFDKEKVPEENARKFAKEIGAIFKLTSACTSVGIEELFMCLGSKFLNPDYKEETSNIQIDITVEESTIIEQNNKNKINRFSNNDN